MKTPYGSQLRNRGLLPHDESVVDDVNAALQASARKHGLILAAAARFVIKNVPSAGKPVRRATSAADEAIKRLPLAPE
jgi:hypothetical protein